MIKILCFGFLIITIIFLIAFLQFVLKILSLKIYWSWIWLKYLIKFLEAIIPFLSLGVGIAIGSGKYLSIFDSKYYWGICLSTFLIIFLLNFVVNSFVEQRSSEYNSFIGPSASFYLTGMLIGIVIHLIF